MLLIDELENVGLGAVSVGGVKEVFVPVDVEVQSVRIGIDCIEISLSSSSLTFFVVEQKRGFIDPELVCGLVLLPVMPI